MNNSITIANPSDESMQLSVTYNIERTGSMQTITCSLDGRIFPIWLQLRRFTLCSREDKGCYTQLYNEVNDSKNFDTSVFIDLVYDAIMKKECLRCS